MYMACEHILSGAFGEQLKLKFHTHRIERVGKMFDMADTQITTTTHPPKDGYSPISLLWPALHGFVWSAFQVFWYSI